MDVRTACITALTAVALFAPQAGAQTADTVRERFRIRLAAAAAASSAQADAELTAAERLAGTYAAKWQDSALYRQLDRFRRWSPAARRTKARADSLRRAGFDAYPRAGPAAAMPAWEESRRLAAAISDSAGLAATLGNLGAGYLALGELDSARAALTQSREIAERLRDWRTLGNALGLLAAHADAAGDLERARVWYARAAVVRLRTGDERGAAADENNVGLIAAELGDTAGARDAYDAALQRNRRAGRFGAAAVNLGNLAALAAAGGRPAEAERLYREAMALHRRAGETAGVARDLRALGNLALRRGEYRAAVQLLDSAATLLVRTGPPGDAAAAFADLAQAWAGTGDLKRAHETLERGEQHARGRDGTVPASLALAAADLAMDADALHEAAAGYARAESLAVLEGDLHLATAAREGRGALQLRRGETAAAVRTLTMAATAQRDGGDRRGAAITALTLGTAQADLGDTAGAQGTLRRALADLRAEADPAGEAAAHGRLGELAERAGSPVRAETAYRAGLRALGDLIAPEIESSLYWGLGRALRMRGDVAGARRHLEHAVTLENGLVHRSAGLFADLASVEAALGDYGAAFETSERLRAPAGARSTVRTAEVTARLQPGEALVEYLVTDSVTLAFVVTRAGVHTVPLPLGRRELAAAIDFARAAIMHDGSRRRAAPAWGPPLRRLHRLLIAPIEQRLASAQIHRLRIVPHAELHYLPFAALMPADGGYLIERYELSFAPSAAVWLELAARERPPAGGRILAVAPFPHQLPGSRDEARSIGRLHPANRVLLGERANETEFRRIAQDYGIVHLATYGVLNRRSPLYSYVAFAADASGPGRMEVHEVLQQRLRARLLVLSACETGLASGAAADVPAGEDWIGLVRAFLTAGADNVVATLWPIGDRATARLMPQFYEGLAGRRPAAALAAVQRAAIRNPATAAPRHWASLTVTGIGEEI